MYTIKGNTISLTRGDSFAMKVDIMRKDEETGEVTEYTPVAADNIRFAVKHKDLKADGSDFADDEPLLVKAIPYNTMVLELEPNDTKEMAFGKYAYDIEIVMEDGWTETFISDTFILTKEVY